MEQYKTCTKCHQSLNLDNFHNDKTRKDGKFPQCRNCQKIKQKEYYLQNKDKFKTKAAEWKANNPERVRASRKKSRELNKEKSQKYQREWARQFRQNNPLHHRRWPSKPEKLKDWRQRNPEKVRMQKLRRRARELGLRQYEVSSKYLKKLLATNCFYCVEPATQIDHVIPVSRGGTHSMGNLVGACQKCNSRKSDSFIMEWRKRESKALLG